MRKSNNKSNSLVLIVPVYNEQEVLEKTINKLLHELKKTKYSALETLIVIADNNSNDDTPEIAKRLSIANKEVLHFQIPLKGRGVVLREVIKNFEADFYAYIDADLPIDPKSFHKLLAPVYLDKTADMVVVKRRYKSRPLYRKLLTYLLHKINSLLFGLELSDIQSGAKVFNINVAQSVVATSKANDYWMDTEFVVKAFQKKFRIMELQVQWIDKRYVDRQSKISLLRDTYAAVKTVHFVASDLYVNFLQKSVALFLLILLQLIFGIWCIYKLFLFSPVKGAPYELTHYDYYSFVVYQGVLFIFSYVLLIKHKINNRLSFIAAKVIFAMYLITAVLIKPIFSQDVFQSLTFAKGFLLSGLSPYAVNMSSLSSISTNVLVGAWRDLSFVQGPSGFLYFLFPALFSSLPLTLILLRLQGALVVVFTFVILRRILQFSKFTQERKLEILTLFLISPFIIDSVVIDNHADGLVMLFILLSVYLSFKKQYVRSYFSVLFTYTVKWVTLLSLPGVLIHSFIRGGSQKRLVLVLCVVSAVVVLGSAWVLLKEPVGVESFMFQASVLSNYDSSPLYVLLSLFLGISNSLIKAFGMLLSLGVAVYYGYRGDLVKAFTFSYLILLMFFTSWLMLWYFLWIYPLLFLLFPVFDIMLFTLVLIFGRVIPLNAVLSLFLVLMLSKYVYFKFRLWKELSL